VNSATDTGSGSDTGGTVTITGNLVGMAMGSATISGPGGNTATGSTKAGGTGTSTNKILPVASTEPEPAMSMIVMLESITASATDPGAATSTVTGSTAIDTTGSFFGLLGVTPQGGLSGGLGGGSNVDRQCNSSTGPTS
jgi:hypothetical protein